MRTDTLRLFTVVVRGGSFAAAARELDVDPSAVSRAIAALERELGVRLFERSTRRFEPTEAGRVFHAGIEPLLDELDRAAARARDVTARPAGRLRVAASIAFGEAVLAPLLGAFRTRYPELSLDLVLSDRAVDLVAERIDVAIRLGPPPAGDVVRSRLLPVAHRVCASPAYLASAPPIAVPHDLAAHDCICFPFGEFSERWRFRARSGALSEIPVRGAVVISNALALRRCVIEGLGPGLLADWMIGDALADGRLVDVLPDFEVTATTFDTAAWLLYPSPTYVPLKVRVFADFLRERLGARNSAVSAAS